MLTRQAETQFARAASELGIECIPANTRSQGRVERRQPDLAGSVGQGNAAGWHKHMDSANAMAAGLHCGLPTGALRWCQKDPSDAHLAYPGTSAELVRTLSVQMEENAVEEPLMSV